MTTQGLKQHFEGREGVITTLGANAVIHLRFDSAGVGHDMSEIVAVGTAVRIEPCEPH